MEMHGKAKSNCGLVLIIGSRASNYENYFEEIMACESFVSARFDLWPMLQGRVGLSY